MPHDATREGPAHEEIAGNPRCGLILACDHARNSLPREYGTLGLPASELERHIAYDIGVEAVTRRVAEALNVPAVFAGYSRLLVDPNRGYDDPTLIMRLSDGAVVPGNAEITPEERQKRIALYYEPYHRALSRAVDRAIAAGHPPAIVSIHSFTPVWRGIPRPWHAGVLWEDDRRFPDVFIEALRRDASLTVGDNEPYAGGLEGDTMHKHAVRRGLPHALLEIRQDLIADEAGVEAWAARLIAILPELERAARHMTIPRRHAP